MGAEPSPDLKDLAARTLLLKLLARGRLTRPAPRTRNGHRAQAARPLRLVQPELLPAAAAAAPAAIGGPLRAWPPLALERVATAAHLPLPHWRSRPKRPSCQDLIKLLRQQLPKQPRGSPPRQPRRPWKTW